MSVQLGRWSWEKQPVAPNGLATISAALAPYGPDSNEVYSSAGVNIIYRAFHTTEESRRETQPYVSPSGTVLTWDGRLDNSAELVCQLDDSLTINSTDLAIVAAAYEKWGFDCFSKLKGDWALSIWNSIDHSLTLAKDPIGLRHLYYSIEKDNVTWSTILDPLVRFSGKTFALNEEYIAGWLSKFPAAYLTPYVGIHSVPPSSFVLLRPGKHAVSKYWDFDPEKNIRYRTDAEYEEHFRTVFEKAVRRRLRSNSPVLAELSGGRDSCSIVCMADSIIVRAIEETPRLDTVSYYNDSEPNWNERPYFTKVEEKRGRVGYHIDVAPQEKAESKGRSGFTDNCRFGATPGWDGRSSHQFMTCLASQGNRIVLSGIGGDEVMGGVPTPTLELEDFLAKRQFRALAHGLKVWALEKRKPWLHLFCETAQRFLPPELVRVPKHMRPPSWLHSKFVNRYWPALTGYPSRVKLFGPRPSFQENLSTLDAMRRQLGCEALPCEPPYEKRYPYLDRDLLEFIYAIPREQLVRPTQRRSLMRRALVSIVPDEILNRKSKAFVARAPLLMIASQWPHFVEMTQHMVSSSLGIVDSEAIFGVLQKARQGREVPTVALMRTMRIESWLRNLHALGYAKVDTILEPVKTLQDSV